MKHKSNIVQLVNLLVLSGSDLTPKDRVRYDSQDNYAGISDEDSTNTELWGVALMEELDVPWLYEHICYGISKTPHTQKGEY